MRFLLTFCLLTLAACAPSASVSFAVGAEVAINGADFALPEALREETASGPRIISLPCPTGVCPSAPGIAIVCEANVCDPAPQTVDVPGGEVIDLDTLAGDAGALFNEVDTIELLGVDYQISQNTLSLMTGDVDVFWGPAGSVGIDESMGVHRIGTLPQIGAGETTSGSLILDVAGVQAFTSHFETVGHRFRFFARTVVDLEPGGAFPEGSVEVAVRMNVRISGSLL